MIELTHEPFGDGELVRFSFAGDGNDAAWKDAMESYTSTPRRRHQYFLIDNRKSRGNATVEGIKLIFQSLVNVGVISLRVAQVSRNTSFDTIALLTEEIGKLENFEVTSRLFETSEEGLVWLADIDEDGK